VEVALSFCLLISFGLSFWGYEGCSYVLPLPTTLPDHAELVPTMLTNVWTELEFGYVMCQASPSLCLAVLRQENSVKSSWDDSHII